MKKLVLAAVVIMAAMALALPASAQKKMKVNQVLNLGGETLEGDLLGPNDEFMSAMKASEHGSLIQYRTDFIPEMLRDVDDL